MISLYPHRHYISYKICIGFIDKMLSLLETFNISILCFLGYKVCEIRPFLILNDYKLNYFYMTGVDIFRKCLDISVLKIMYG